MSNYMADFDAEYYLRMKHHPDITFTTCKTDVVARLQRQFGRNEPIYVNLPGWCGAAYVLKLAYRYPIDSQFECDAVLRPTGRPTERVTDTESGISMRLDYVEMAMSPLNHPMCRISSEHPFFNQTKKETPVKIRNKYYVAAAKVSTELEQAQDNVSGKISLANGSGTNTRGYGENTGRWTRKDLKGAVEHAEQILEANPTQDHVVIVKMVRIVRRKKAPLVVEVL